MFRKYELLSIPKGKKKIKILAAIFVWRFSFFFYLTPSYLDFCYVKKGDSNLETLLSHRTFFFLILISFIFLKFLYMCNDISHHKFRSIDIFSHLILNLCGFYIFLFLLHSFILLSWYQNLNFLGSDLEDFRQSIFTKFLS